MKISYEQFNEHIEAVRELSRINSALNKCGVDISAYQNKWNAITLPLIKALFNKAQRETIDWWLYDSPNAIEGDPTGPPRMWDKDKSPIYTRNTKELYQYLLTEEADSDG